MGVLGVEVATDFEATFVPHHMWFKNEHLVSFKARICEFFGNDDPWQALMMRSAKRFHTFSEYWAYCSWVKAKAPEDLTFHAYNLYGVRNERFFDDGQKGRFSAALRTRLDSSNEVHFMPSYQETLNFIRESYGAHPLPSSINFEKSERHMKKGLQNLHLEELRSRWHPLVQQRLNASPSV